MSVELGCHLTMNLCPFILRFHGASSPLCLCSLDLNVPTSKANPPPSGPCGTGCQESKLTFLRTCSTNSPWLLPNFSSLLPCIGI